MTMTQTFQNVEIMGGRLAITRDELMLRLETCIDMQTKSKAENDFSTWLIAVGYSEAIKDLLASFESND